MIVSSGGTRMNSIIMDLIGTYFFLIFGRSVAMLRPLLFRPEIQGEDEAKERSRHKNSCYRVVRKMEERSVGTKRKSPKQDLTSAKDLTMELPEEHEFPYHR